MKRLDARRNTLIAALAIVFQAVSAAQMGGGMMGSGTGSGRGNGGMMGGNGTSNGMMNGSIAGMMSGALAGMMGGSSGLTIGSDGTLYITRSVASQNQMSRNPNSQLAAIDTNGNAKWTLPFNATAARYGFCAPDRNRQRGRLYRLCRHRGHARRKHTVDELHCRNVSLGLLPLRSTEIQTPTESSWHGNDGVLRRRSVGSETTSNENKHLVVLGALRRPAARFGRFALQPNTARHETRTPHIASLSPFRINHQFAGKAVGKPTTMAICIESQYTAWVGSGLG